LVNQQSRFRLPILVKCILKRYGYQPELSADAIQTLLEQAEGLLREVAL
jgi:hypothetical protein